MPFSSKKANVHQSLLSAKNTFEQSRNCSLGDLPLKDLFAQARDERNGLKYMTEEWSQTITFDPHGSNNVGPLETETIVHPSNEDTLNGDPKRYQEICEVIAIKLIYCNPDELEAFKKNCIDDAADRKTQNDVYEILKDKYKQSIDDLMELSKHYPKGGNREKFVEPLEAALDPYSTNEQKNILALDSLRKYKQTLLEKKEGSLSIAEQLKETGDRIAIKILKGILLTLGTGTAYAWYALKQAVTGEASYKWVDNPAERLAKNAESRLLSRYQSLQHLRLHDKGLEKTAVNETSNKGLGY